jgi:hypothetical protein
LVAGSTITDSKQSATIELKEIVTKYEMTKEEIDIAIKKRIFWSAGDHPQYGWIANGTLEFRADSSGYSTGKRWRESPLNRMEDRLEGIANDLASYLVKKEEDDIQRAIQAEEARKERQKQQEIEKAHRRVAGRKRRFLRMAEAYSDYQKLYNLMLGLKEAGAAELSPEFYQWAENIVSSQNPVTHMLADIHKGIDPVEPSQEELYPPGEKRWSTFY